MEDFRGLGSCREARVSKVEILGAAPRKLQHTPRKPWKLGLLSRRGGGVLAGSQGSSPSLGHRLGTRARTWRGRQVLQVVAFDS